MKCPECKVKIGFIESLTILNPFNFKCQKCNSSLSISRSSTKAYLLLFCIIPILSFTGSRFLTAEGILTSDLLKVVVPVILLMVVGIHYLFWNRADAKLKKEDKSPDFTNC